MRYTTEPRFAKYGKGSGFLSFSRKFAQRYAKTVMDTATKTWIGAAKTSSERVLQKTAEATGDLIGNKILDKITSIGKPKEKGTKKNWKNLYSTREKATNYWWLEIILKNVILLYKNGISKNCKLSWYSFW